MSYKNVSSPGDTHNGAFYHPPLLLEYSAGSITSNYFRTRCCRIKNSAIKVNVETSQVQRIQRVCNRDFGS